MLEVEIQKLTAAVEALVKVMQSMDLHVSRVNKAEQSYHEDNAAREAMQAEDAARKDAEEAAMAAMYKREIERTAKRKAKVTKEETEALIEAAKPVEKPVVTDQPLKDEPKEVVSDITAEDLKTMAMEIARADSSTRTIILEILGEHGAKTITQLDPKNYRAVHGRLMSLAHDIAKNGEEA